MEFGTRQVHDKLKRLEAAADDLSEHGQHKEAEALYRQALMLCRFFNQSQTDQANRILKLADCIQQQGQLELAEDHYRWALDLFQSTEVAHPNQVRCMMRLSFCIWRQGKLEEAQKLRDVALAHYNVFLEEIEQLRTLAGEAYQREELPKAESLYRQALSLYRDIDGRQGDQATCTMNLAICIEKQGRLTQAEYLYTQALDSLKSIEGRQGDQATCTMNLAACLATQGQHLQAEKLNLQALKLFKSTGTNPLAAAKCIANLADCLQRRKQFKPAEDLYMTALEMFKSLDNSHSAQAICAMNLANIFVAQRRIPGAIRLYKEALEIFETIAPNPVYEAHCFSNVAHCLSITDPLNAFNEQDKLLTYAQNTFKRLRMIVELNSARYQHAVILVRRANICENLEQRHAILSEALGLAVPAALDVDTRRYQFPSKSRRRIWMETTAAPRIDLALQLAAKTGNAKLISDLIAVWRTAGTLNHDGETKTAVAPSSSQTTDTALDIVLTETAISGDPTPWAPPLAAGTTESAHEYNLKRKPTPTLLMPNGPRKAAEPFTTPEEVAAYYR